MVDFCKLFYFGKLLMSCMQSFTEIVWSTSFQILANFKWHLFKWQIQKILNSSISNLVSVSKVRTRPLKCEPYPEFKIQGSVSMDRQCMSISFNFFEILKQGQYIMTFLVIICVQVCYGKFSMSRIINIRLI